MKRILLFAGFFLLLSVFAVAQDTPEDDMDEVQDFSYSMNGKGDQYIKIAIMPNFPLNFGDKLYVGGAAELGYYRFLNSWLALGGELSVGYNPTLGSNSLTFVPITFGVSFQPAVWKFEFPITLSTGFAFETCQNRKYFPGFVAKAEAGAFFRMTEGWSFGLGSDFLYLPQWYTTDERASSDYGLFLTAFVAARYHF